MKKVRSLVILILLAMLLCALPAMAMAQYVVAGSDTLCGSYWDGTDARNALDAANQRTFYSVRPGSYQIKVVKDGSAWYGDWFGNNIHFDVTATCDVTVKLVREGNGGVSVTGTGVKVTNSIVLAGNGDANNPA